MSKNPLVRLQKIFIDCYVGESHDNDSCSLAYENVKPKPLIHDDENIKVLIFGHPILNDRINPRAVLDFILKRELSDSFLREINGEFLIVLYCKKQKKLLVINDRFASIPLYYGVFGCRFVGSFSYSDLWLWLKNHDLLQVNSESFFELLYFRRLLGETTHDHLTQYFPPASCLRFDGERLHVASYWTPNYTKTDASITECANNLASAVRQSIHRKTTDDKRYGLFLSGGMDTRTVLAAFDKSLTCFTATAVKEGNREYQVAKTLAELKGFQHIHLPFQQAHNSSIFDDAVKLGGCMYEPNAIFMGFEETVAKKADVLFHGHGFDYMFQGMYVPSQHFYLFGRKLRARKIRPLKSDLIDEFMNTVSYRLKYPGFIHCLRPEMRDQLTAYLRKQLSALLERGMQYTDNPYDLWEYLSFHAISRHYSYPDHASIHTNAEQRSISFDNDLYNMYLSLPTEFRFDARVLRRALHNIDPRFVKVPSANDGYPIASSNIKMVYQLKDSLLARCHLKPRIKDSHLQRTWLTHQWLIENEQRFRQMAVDLDQNAAIAQFEWLDVPKIQSLIQQWLSGARFNHSERFADFVWNLIGINHFLFHSGQKSK